VTTVARGEDQPGAGTATAGTATAGRAGQGPVTADSAVVCTGLGPGATLDDAFRHYTGDTLDNAQGGIRDVRRARRTARRLG
jgi:hypothetical protein